MTFKLFRNEINELVKNSLNKIGSGEQKYDLLEPPNQELGDISCNVAFLLSKEFKRSPREIASELVKKWIGPDIEENKKFTFVESAEAHPTGYINFRLSFVVLGAATFSSILKEQRYGFEDFGRGRKVMLEHTSVNPTKALHIGHLRNVVLGDVLYRLFKETNHDVVALNYIDDSGLQVADVIVGFLYAKIPLESLESSVKFDKYCGDEIYVMVNKLYKNNPRLLEMRKDILSQLEAKHPEISSLASRITIKVLKGQLTTCWRIRAHYDLLAFESHIVHSGLWDCVFAILKANKIIQFRTEGKNRGCWVYVPLRELDEKVIVKSDGTTTYIARDITFAALKVGIVEDPFTYRVFAIQWDKTDLWTSVNIVSDRNSSHHLDSGDNLSHSRPFFPGEISITLIDDRQKRLQDIIGEILGMIDNDSFEYLGLGYGPVTITARTARQLGLRLDEKLDSVHMSGRLGVSVDADFVLDRLHARAKQEAKERNPSLADIHLDRIAEELAISAIRYFLIKSDVGKIIKFDLEDSLNLTGDSGPYIQYTHARLCSLLEKSGKKADEELGVDDNLGEFVILLNLDLERDIVKLLSKFGNIMEESVKNYEPKVLARYIYKLANVFNTYYEKVPIVLERDIKVAYARIMLSKAVKSILDNGMRTLGMSPLERM
jgi:arginyl-tRNA synthetase